MTTMQTRYLNTIGINNSEDITKYKIPTIEKLLETHGKKRLTKILTDPTHPITKSLEERESITRKNFPFVIAKCKSEKYQKSFLQKYLRILEKDGYGTKTKPATKPPANNQKTNKKVICEVFKKELKNERGVKTHRRMMKH